MIELVNFNTQFEINNTVILIMIFTLIAQRIRTLYSNIYYVALSNFVGTVFHELAHFCMALIFFKIPTSFSVIPRSEDRKYELGRVELKYNDMNILNQFPIAMAPLMIFPLVIFNTTVHEIYFLTFGESLISKLVMIYLLIVLIVNSLPSSADLRLAASGSFVFWAFLTILYLNQDYFNINDVYNYLKGLHTIFEKEFTYVF